MSKFSDKDFFGDPIWPSELKTDKDKLIDSENSNPFSTKKYSSNQESSQNSYAAEQNPIEAEEFLELDKSFYMNEQKMLCSNFKHSEVTYLDDSNKGILFGKEETQNLQKSQEKGPNDSYFQESQQKSVKLIKYEEMESESDSSWPSSNDELQSQSEMQNVSEPQNNRRKKSSHNLLQRQALFYERKTRTLPKIQKSQSELIQELISEILQNDDEENKKTLKIESQIISKLQANKKEQNKLTKIEKSISKSIEKKEKCLRYKILTQKEKEFLVYLTTKTTTCEVARRFGVSVNNICRWKKGCKRKVGAGRKITNQELEQKMILYVKNLIENGLPFTRRQIQMKAKQLCQNKSFKASKGWFERFYNRNINTFLGIEIKSKQ